MNYLKSTESQTNNITSVCPIKILQVVGCMNRGGVETWLMHILRNIDRDLFQMDFVLHTSEPCHYNDEIRSLGCRIIVSPYMPHPNRHWWNYVANFKQILQEYGPYDIVHSHLDYFSGNILRLAKQAGVKVRIAHAHNDTSLLIANGGWKKRFYVAWLKQRISRYTTVGLPCSRKAAVDLFGSNWESDLRWQILYCGLNLEDFQQQVNPILVRAELGIPQDAFVVGHVGRFEPQKNHQFLVQIAAEIARQESKMRLLLIGYGSLRQEVEKQIAQLGLTDKVIFAGVRSDIPRLMLGAMDVFLLPSLFEGLPLVLIEAQAAGLPCIFSDVISDEIDVVKPLMKRLSLSQKASQWAEIILAQKPVNLTVKPTQALSILQKNSPFNIEFCVKKLTNIYSNECHKNKML
jgi:glycosyltransferase involved in cell wall biosynthesis